MNISLNIYELPVSVNKLYQRSKYGGIFLNPKVTAFKALIILELDKINFEMTTKNVKVDIEFHVTKNNIDIDNLCKVVLDSLNKKVYKDDKQVYELNIKKIVSKEKMTKITITEIDLR